MNTIIKPIIRFLSTRVIILYLLLFGVSLLFVDYKSIRNKAIIRNLNDNLPGDFNYLIALGGREGDMPVDQKNLQRYERYYELVTGYLPQLADAHGMLGFSYFYLGKIKKSISEYEKAAVLNPHFFWFPYNLGVLHFLNGDYEKAANYFELAREKKPDKVPYIIQNSIEYKRALVEVTNINEILMAKLKSGYSECYRLLMISRLKLKDYRKVIGLAQEAVTSGLNYPEIFLYYASVAAFELNDYESSADLLRRALAIDGHYAQAYYQLSLTLKALGNEEAASQMMARYMLLKQQHIEKRPREQEAYLRII